jgi:glycosyltransferase involved in cell wall biosynthesis
VSTSATRDTIRLTSIVEASTLTGPARNILDFCRVVRDWEEKRECRPRVQVSILTFKLRGLNRDSGMTQTPTPFVRAAREFGVPVEEIEERFRFDPRVLAKLRLALTRRPPDIIETHSVKSHFLARLLGAPQLCSWIAFHHGYTTTDLKMRIYNQADRWSLRASNGVISLCAAFVQQLKAAGVGDERIHVVRSSIRPDWGTGLPPEAAEALRGRYGVKPNERVVLSVGRLSEEKGHVELVKAIAQLSRSRAIPTRLIIVGDGPERGTLERTARSLRIADRVLLAGHIDQVDLCYKLADVFVLPSYTEGSPVALLEAMVSRTPVVATAVGGVPEMITADSGLLVPPRRPDLLGNAIVRLLTDRELGVRLAANAHATAVQNYRPEVRARRLLDVYKEVIRNRRGERC